MPSFSSFSSKWLQRNIETNEPQIYSGRIYEKCELLRKYFDHPALTTDVIVGFPQESEEEFEITKQFLKKVNFYETHIFKYSRRKGTRAADMEGQIPEEIKTRRSHILQQVQ